MGNTISLLTPSSIVLIINSSNVLLKTFANGSISLKHYYCSIFANIQVILESVVMWVLSVLLYVCIYMPSLLLFLFFRYSYCQE